MKAVLTGKFLTVQACFKKRKISNEQPNPTFTKTEEQQQTKPRVSRRKEIIKIIAELNEIETQQRKKTLGQYH